MFKPKLPTFLKLPKYKKFDYKPVFYKPELESRHNKTGIPNHKERIRAEFSTRGLKKNNFNKNHSKRMALIFLALLGLLYLLFK